MRSFFRRHQPPVPCPCWIKAGLGGLLGIGVVGWLSQVSGAPLLIAPFGASAVLLFALPKSPLSQPANAIGGHLLSAGISLALHAALPAAWWAVALAVGVVIFAMAALRVIHPPAGADPIIVFAGGASGPGFLVMPILAGAAALVAIAFLVHRLPPRTAYPLPAAAEKAPEGRPA
jgi:CBS-domain-containing membrane protein